MSAKAVGAVLEQEGYTCSQIDRYCWRGHFRSHQHAFPFLVHIDEEQELLTMAVVPFVKSPEDDTVCKALYNRLLELNQVLLLAKFSIDDDLDVVLSVAHPTQSLQSSEIRDGLSALLYYADNHVRELEKIIEDGLAQAG